jgi:hypothetical protein
MHVENIFNALNAYFSPVPEASHHRFTRLREWRNPQDGAGVMTKWRENREREERESYIAVVIEDKKSEWSRKSEGANS